MVLGVSGVRCGEALGLTAGKDGGSEVDLSSARIVVAGGRGVQDAEVRIVVAGGRGAQDAEMNDSEARQRGR